MFLKNDLFQDVKVGCRTAFAAASLVLTGGCASMKETPPPPVVYVDAADATELSAKLPALYSVFQNMARRPLTGKDVYETVTNPANGIRCAAVSSRRLGSSTAGNYTPETKTLTVRDDMGPDAAQTAVHESFHASQFVRNPLPLALEKDDYARAILLSEAAAVAYTFVYYREGAAASPADYKRFFRHEDNKDLGEIFEKAYAEKYKTFSPAGEKSREEAALEAGGQAVVRALLAGKDEKWTRYYAFNADFMSRRWAAVIPVQDKQNGAYEKNRALIFSGFGRVSGNINLTPPELLRQAPGSSGVSHAAL